MSLDRLDTRLVTRADLTGYLDPEAAGPAASALHNTLIDACIVRASGDASGWCERMFEGGVRTVVLDGTGQPRLYLPAWPVAQPVPTRTRTFTSGGTYRVRQGDTITGATSAATATVSGVGWLTTGTWALGTAEGTLYLYGQTGTFVAENLNIGAELNVATIAAGNSTAIATADQHGVWYDADRTFADADLLTEDWAGSGGDYVIIPGEDGHGVLETDSWAKGTRVVQVRMLMGYDYPPEPVRQAALRLTAMYYQQATGPHGYDVQQIIPSGGTIEVTSRVRMPKDVEALLQSYRREWY